MPSIKITKGTVDRLAHPPQGQKLFMDEALKGFGVLVSANTKTYVAQRDIGGRTVRVTLGRHGVISTAQAKREAEEAIGLMRRSTNPNEFHAISPKSSCAVSGSVATSSAARVELKSEWR